MLDVIHYIFEEDATYVSEQQHKSKEVLRERLYRDMYGTEYAYTKNFSADEDYGDFGDPEVPDDLGGITPVDPLKPATKGYVPPTDFDPNRPNPFGGVLDAPLG